MASWDTDDLDPLPDGGLPSMPTDHSLSETALLALVGRLSRLLTKSKVWIRASINSTMLLPVLCTFLCQKCYEQNICAYQTQTWFDTRGHTLALDMAVFATSFGYVWTHSTTSDTFSMLHRQIYY